MSKPSFPAHPDGKTMKAVVFSDYGKETSALSVQEVAMPFIEKPDEVLIKVHASSLNPIDKARVSGALAMMLPEKYEYGVVGYDVAGVIEEVGEKAAEDGYKVGDEIYVRVSRPMKYGSTAEYAVSSTHEICKKPSNLSFSEAASIPLAGLTALQCLRKGGVTEGSKVFITGGAGGVGSLAIQIAKKVFKAGFVCTTASPGVGTDICTKAGADRIVDYRSEKFEEVLAGEDFDMVFDTTSEAPRMTPLLKKGGMVVSIAGMPSIQALEEWLGGSVPFMLRVFAFIMKPRSSINAAEKAGGSWLYGLLNPNGKDLAELRPYFESGDIIPFIDTEAKSIDDFKEAADKLWSGRSKGKCVIKIA